ncbi:MAG: hypothetical protein NTV56_25290 [Alphaproteobacteria bacterium]|nr:hypothetical protein [Alphaproteobacteria bacterium]
MVRRALANLEEKGKGILLLHDIQPATALALPELLRELKARGFRVVQVVPGKGDMGVPMAARSAPAAAPTPTQSQTQTVAAPAPVAAVAAVKPEPAAAAPMLPAIVPRKLDAEPPAPQKPAALPVSASDSMARSDDSFGEPVRPYTSGTRPSRTMPTPDKFVTTEPGGWPPTVSVAVPAAGGIGVASRAGLSQTPDGRFLQR